MDFRTTISIARAPFSISHRRLTMLIGSCFTENIGRMMIQDLFPVEINPTGVLYNPASIASALDRIMENRTYTESELVEDCGVYHSMDHHSSFSSPEKTVMLSRINQSLATAHDTLSNAETLIVTFGTATAYNYLATGRVAGNCHKLPQSSFKKIRFTVDEITDMWTELTDRLERFNRNLKLIFTVSPIRYKAYGMHGSQVDKAILLMATEQIVEQLGGKAFYFPAYEIMLDDLRDYRFYDTDMIHPSKQAVEYIYESFQKTFYDKSTIEFASQCNKLTRRLSHRFMVNDPVRIKAFKNETETIIKRLSEVESNIEQLVTNFAKWQHSMQ